MRPGSGGGSGDGDGDGDGDQDEDEDIERGVLLRPYEHDKRMMARMRQAGGTSKVWCEWCRLCAIHTHTRVSHAHLKEVLHYNSRAQHKIFLAFCCPPHTMLGR